MAIVDLNTLKMHGMGSITNAIEVSGGDPEPTVGMGATRYMWTDRHAMTVVEVGPKDAKGIPSFIVLQADTCKRTDDNGMSECQSYSYEPNPQGEKLVAKFHAKSGKWREVGATCNPYESTGDQILASAKKARPNQKASIVKLGARREYHDYSH